MPELPHHLARRDIPGWGRSSPRQTGPPVKTAVAAGRRICFDTCQRTFLAEKGRKCEFDFSDVTLQETATK
jgi:hypothetical protein